MKERHMIYPFDFSAVSSEAFSFVKEKLCD